MLALKVASKAAAMRGVPPPHPIHHTQNSQLTSFGSDIEMNPNILMSTQSSELDRAANATEYTSLESGQISALKQENKMLKVGKINPFAQPVAAGCVRSCYPDEVFARAVCSKKYYNTSDVVLKVTATPRCLTVSIGR